MQTTQLFSSRITTGASSAISLNSSDFTAQASGKVSATTGAATVKIQVSNDNANWIDLGTIEQEKLEATNSILISEQISRNDEDDAIALIMILAEVD